MEPYITVNERGSAELTIEKSVFIAYCKRVESQEEAEEFISEIKKKHYDATHNVFAYRLNRDPLVEKSSDDGEPSGTAGLPVLNLLRQRNIRNVCVVVTRYFGGIKLGKGGLVRAYAQSAKEGLNATGLVSKEVFCLLCMELPYPLWGRIKNELDRRETLIKETVFTDVVKVVLYCRPDDMSELSSVLINLSEGKSKVEAGESEYLDVEVKE